MRDRADRANGFAMHTGNIAGRIYGNGVKSTDKACFLRAYSYTGPAFDAGIPPYIKNYSLFWFHAFIFYFYRLPEYLCN